MAVIGIDKMSFFSPHQYIDMVDLANARNIDLVENPDILATLGQQKTTQYLVGFAAETQDLLTYAQNKLEKKNADMLVANDVSKAQVGFGHDTNDVSSSELPAPVGVTMVPVQSARELLAAMTERFDDTDVAIMAAAVSDYRVATPADQKMKKNADHAGLTPDEILALADLKLRQQTGRLAGKKVVVSAGGTVEPIDPVRFITNRSSGKMGYALAQAAAEQGADVTLGDDAASSVLLARHTPVIVAPAMNVNMYENPATQRNLKTLREDGVIIIEPAEGMLAEGYAGKGRLPEVVMTQAATEFVTPKTFEALTQHPVVTDLFDAHNESMIAHVSLADWADYIFVVPATANILAKMAAGINQRYHSLFICGRASW
ncbi:hypothetical protein H7R52_11990 [Weissella confusa]|uniref:Phosphopantothenoylcysteine decarboxylase n=1 Tax=Weissella confusa TaxID=1583 RepID=A0A923NFZ7_WEICO|nr:hypothetical protein [Weissella confusa]